MGCPMKRVVATSHACDHGVGVVAGAVALQGQTPRPLWGQGLVPSFPVKGLCRELGPRLGRPLRPGSLEISLQGHHGSCHRRAAPVRIAISHPSHAGGGCPCPPAGSQEPGAGL